MYMYTIKVAQKRMACFVLQFNALESGLGLSSPPQVPLELCVSLYEVHLHADTSDCCGAYETLRNEAARVD